MSGSWLQELIRGYVYDNGSVMTLRSKLNFVGAVLTDDINNEWTEITVSAASLGATALATANTLALRGASAECAFAALTGTVITGSTSVLAPAFDRASAGTLQIGPTTATAIQLGQAGVGVTFAGSTITSAAATNFTMQYGSSTRLVLTSPGASVTGVLVASTSVHAPAYDRASAGALTFGAANATSASYGNTSCTDHTMLVSPGGAFGVVDGATVVFACSTAGVACDAPYIQFDDGQASVAINQATTGGATGGAFSLTAQAAATTGGALNLAGGAGATLGGALNLAGGAGTTDGSVNLKGAAVTMLEAGEVGPARRFVALCVGGQLTTTELPANAGDRVVWLSDAATAPTAAPGTGGLVIYAEGNALKAVNSSGTIRTIHGAGNTTHAAEAKRIIEDDATINTTNNTITAIVTIALPDDTTTTIEAVVMARRTDGGGVANAGYWLRATYEKAGGVAALVAVNATGQENAGAAAYAGSVAVSGASAAITGLGGTGETVEWFTTYVVRYRT